MEVKARVRRDRCVWGIVRGRTRRCRGDDGLVSLCKTSGRNDDMVVQRQTTNLIKRAIAALEEHGLSWTDETPGVKTDTQRLLLGNHSILSTHALFCYYDNRVPATWHSHSHSPKR